jgi:hypothetical protein
MISALGLVGVILVCAFCRQPDIGFFSPITVFNRKKKLTPNGSKLYVICLVVLLVGLALQVVQRASGAAGLPSCGDEDTQKLLKSAFDESQVARSENLSLVEASNISEVSGADKSKRVCRAQISLNNAANAQIRYQLEPRKDGQVLLSFEVE